MKDIYIVKYFNNKLQISRDKPTKRDEFWRFPNPMEVIEVPQGYLGYTVQDEELHVDQVSEDSEIYKRIRKKVYLCTVFVEFSERIHYIYGGSLEKLEMTIEEPGGDSGVCVWLKDKTVDNII